LRSVYYDYDKWDLRDDAKTELDKMIDILKSDAQLRGEFLGHTDTRGSQKYNDRLSRKRAEAALNYVVSKGITKRRLSWRKFSEDIPKAQNDVKSEQKLQINRRVDLRIRKSGKILYDTQKSVIEMK
jgi:peptidoglycan-associated lipoprotein